MLKKNKISCVIPARLESSRFPRKVLATLLGKPLLQWVWEAANNVSFFDNIIFAIDSEITAKLIQSFGGKFILTSATCSSGTDRIIEVALSGNIGGDIWVCWQADEPFINPEMIKSLLQECDDKSTSIWTLKKKIENENELICHNVVKVVSDAQGKALYFSRSPIPFYRNFKGNFEEKTYYKHIGIYAYTKKALQTVSKLKISPLEQAEKLEQLRFLQNGLSIKVFKTNHDVVGIDTQLDLEKAEQWAQSRVECCKNVTSI
jgi:3-deoxy-D-manno-octulosonate cytidylyltransferase